MCSTKFKYLSLKKLPVFCYLRNELLGAACFWVIYVLSDVEKNSHAFYNPNVHYRPHKNPSLACFICLMNSFQFLPSSSCRYIFIFCFYQHLGIQSAFYIQLCVSKPCMNFFYLPCPINLRGTNVQYDLRNLAFLFPELRVEGAREFIL
jgi:hypothetical protein